MVRFRNFILLFCLLVAGTSAAQNISDLPPGSDPYNLRGYSNMVFDNRYEGVRGTFMFLEEFSTGLLEMTKGKFNNVQLNYDAYTDNVIVKNEKLKEIIQLRKDLITSFTLRSPSGTNFLFTKRQLQGTQTFLLEIRNDTIAFYCKAGKKLKKADIGGAYNTTETKYDEFVNVNTYYISKGGGEFIELQTSKKGILRAFPEFHEPLSAYLKKNKVDFNNFDQVKLFAEYINQL